MKNFFFHFFMFVAIFFCVTEKLYSQQLKVAVFDIDSMVHALHEYATVNSLMEIYAFEDTIEIDYQILCGELKRLDSVFINAGTYNDERHIKLGDSVGYQIQKLKSSIDYLKPIVEQHKNDEKQILAGRLYEKVNIAFKKVTNEKKYDRILKISEVEPDSDFDNLFILVAKELKLTSLPANLLKIGNKMFSL